MKEGEVSILLIDDHALILQAIKSILEQVPEVHTIAMATSGAMVRKMLATQTFDFFILDIELPDIHGVDLIQEIRQSNENARIIVRTMHEEVWMVRQLMQSEIDSVVIKSSDATEIKQAVCDLLQGQPYYSPHFKAVQRKLCNGPLLLEMLSPRELDVLKGITNALNTSQIANLLGLSDNTIETHRKKIMIKMDAVNVADLVMKSISLGIIPVKGMRDYS